MQIKKYIYISTAVLGMLAGASALSANANASQVQKAPRTEFISSRQGNDDANAEKRMTKPGMLGMTRHVARTSNHRNPMNAHLNYHDGHVVPTPGSSNAARTGFGAPIADGHYDNYLNGRYAIWSKPGYFNKKGHYVPRGVMITSKAGSTKLALDQVPFKGLKMNKDQTIMEITSRNYTGWIDRDGLYQYNGNEGRLPIHYPSKHARRHAKMIKRHKINHKHQIIRKRHRMNMRKNRKSARHTRRHMKMNKGMKRNKKKSMNMKNMNMSSNMLMHGTPAPKSLKAAKHPRFRNGANVVVKADHMPGMKDARAKVVGAYNTKLYEVNYISTKTHKVVRNHKWLVGPEIKANRKGSLKVGESVQLKANHMKDMYNAKAKIVGIHNGPAYMINYRPTNNKKMMVTNHKWLTQNELTK